MQPNSPQAAEENATRGRIRAARVDPEPAPDLDNTDDWLDDADGALTAGTFVGLEDGEDEELLNRLDDEGADSLRPTELLDFTGPFGFDAAEMDDEPLVLDLRPSTGHRGEPSPARPAAPPRPPAAPTAAETGAVVNGMPANGGIPGGAAARRSGTADRFSAYRIPGGRTPVVPVAPATPAAGATFQRRQRRPGEVSENRIAVWDEATVQAYRERLLRVQARFIDDPREAVEQARALAVEAVRGLTAAMLAAADELDPRHGVTSPDTETMRVSIRRYSDFLDRIMAL